MIKKYLLMLIALSMLSAIRPLAAASTVDNQNFTILQGQIMKGHQQTQAQIQQLQANLQKEIQTLNNQLQSQIKQVQTQLQQQIQQLQQEINKLGEAQATRR